MLCMGAVIGIDPGLTGAVAVIAHGQAVVHDMPVIGTSATATVKRSVDAHGLARILKIMPGTVWIERVNAFPGQGVASMFSLGHSFGVALGVAAALGYPTHLVSPAEWKRFFKLGKDKELSRALASRLYPGVKLDRMKDHGRAEALLIARYGALSGGVLC